MITTKNIFIKSMMICTLVAMAISCKDDEMGTLDLKRQFQPGSFDITEGETSTEIAWDASHFTIPGEVEYTLELSKSPDFTNIEFEHTTTETQATVLDTDIDIRTDYYARVKAKGTNGSGDSNWLVSEPFQITGEIFILPIREYDILDDGALIRWEQEETLTTITITPQTGAPFDVAISAGEYSAGQKLVENLDQNTAYKAEVFNADGVSKGYVTFRTKQSYEGDNVVDLRAITGKPKILRDTLQDIPSGSVVWLRRGEVYTIDNTDAVTDRVFSKSVTIMSGPDLNPNFARIHLTTNFNFVANNVIDSVVFRDVVFKGVRAAGASFDNDYVLNSNVIATVGKVRLDNCKISRLRGLVRLQAAAPGTQVANYYVNNCVVDSIREFAIVMASGGSAFANVKISNSTFSKCRRYVNHAVAGNNLLTIENVTFNEVPSGGAEGAEANYVIDFNTINANVVMTNCILGKTWNEGAGNFVRGVRGGATSTYNVTNTYTLSDFISTNAPYLIPGASSYTGSSTTVFQDPATGNFTIKDLSFPGATSAGDPRWRP